MKSPTIQNYLVIAIFCTALSTGSVAQNHRLSFAISNNVTAMPVTGFPQVFYSQCHPGAEATMSWKINKNEKNRLFLNASSGFYYHRFVQSLIWIYPSVNYERYLGKRFNMAIGLGGGYALAIEDAAVLKLNSEGYYEKDNSLALRSQFIGQLELSARYALYKDKPEGVKLMLQFKNYLQGTYTVGYIPVLPINSVLIGISIPLNSKSNEKSETK